ncbi:helix-turn-helix domain-containing protein [Streptomyces sp. NPDC048623]|uniref:PucR family transcriptional regulator n=1 Tax=Streptomyces sp. NPDC048623 TaxID=3155761 RepID=UPI0034483B97
MADPRVTARITALGERLTRELPELTQALQNEMTGRILDLRGDRVLVELLAASIRSNLETVVQVLRHGVDVDDVTTPAGAREYARRLAQHGVSPNALVRAYRLGQRMVLDWAYALIVEGEPDARLALEAYHELSRITHRYIDSVSEQMIAEYQQERERWLARRSTVRAEILGRLIAGEPVNVATAESGLGHRLRQRHLGALLWTSGPSSWDADLGALENAAFRLGKAIGGPGSPLFWPRDRTTGWVWFTPGPDAPVPDPAELEAALADLDPQVRVALGTPASGPDGFRVTHLEALRAQQVALVAQERSPRVTSYGDAQVRAASLLVGDLDEARRLVAGALGGLAVDTENAERLRETMLAFVTERGSYLATSQRLHLHKNTVKYRIEKAVEERGRPIDEDRLDLELALIACRWLRTAVLQPATR